MEIKNKKIVCLGDSITEGVGASSSATNWVSVLQQTYPDCKVYNFGIGGTRIARKKTPSQNTIWDRDFLSRVEELPEEADIVLVFGGTNDWGHGDAALGKISDRDEHTFYGALNLLCDKLIHKYPVAHLVFFTPLHRADEGKHTFSDGEHTLYEFVVAIKEVAREYSLPVLDLYETAGIQPQIPAQMRALTADGLHPNDCGYRRLAEKIAAFLPSL